MAPRLLKQFGGCKPLGLILGLIVLGSALLVAFAAVGKDAFTPSDMLQQYNDGVTSWIENVAEHFRDRRFLVCERGSMAACVELQGRVTEDGIPPSEEYLAYNSLIYVTPEDKPVLSMRTAFQCSAESHTVALDLYTAHTDKAGVEILTAFDPQPDPFPLFSYRWANTTSKEECDESLGLFWKARVSDRDWKNYCAMVFMVDDICITVNQTGGYSQWGVSPFKISHSAGCRPYPLPVATGCGTELKQWSFGQYTLVNGSTIKPQSFFGETASNGSDTAPCASGDEEQCSDPGALPGKGRRAPLTLPTDRDWLVNLTSVGVQLRYVYDPRLNAEDVTGGTLSLQSWLDSGTYAFDGALIGYFGMVMFVTGLTVGLLSILITFVVAAFFPRLRFEYLYQSVHPDFVPEVRKRSAVPVSANTPLPLGATHPPRSSNISTAGDGVVFSSTHPGYTSTRIGRRGESAASVSDSTPLHMPQHASPHSAGSAPISREASYSQQELPSPAEGRRILD
eukprot:Rhum_TRINITY_DN21005_c0_g1::Rhum_TRINITY_DN21005_c0_g1_i1::g.172893::m.172893